MENQILLKRICAREFGMQKIRFKVLSRVLGKTRTLIFRRSSFAPEIFIGQNFPNLRCQRNFLGVSIFAHDKNHKRGTRENYRPTSQFCNFRLCRNKRKGKRKTVPVRLRYRTKAIYYVANRAKSSRILSLGHRSRCHPHRSSLA